MKRIPLTKGKEALVDDQDYDHLMQWKWFFSGGYARRSTYPYGRGRPIQVAMHKEVSQRKGLRCKEVDHIDRNGLNNTRGNLRPATRRQQAMNRGLRKDDTSGYKGVCWHQKTGKWAASIMHNGRREHMATFVDPKRAAAAYNERALEYFGEFAQLNKV